MAEALGIVASLAALIQLAGYAREFGSALYRFSKDAGMAMWEIQNFANNARAFSHMVLAADVSLRKFCREHSNSAVLAYIARHRILDVIAEQSNVVGIDLMIAMERLESLSGGQFPVVAYIKWTFQKNSILALFPAMESIKVDLQLMILIAMLETINTPANLEPSSHQADKKDERDYEMKSLRILIKSNLRMMNRLERQLQKAQWQGLPRAASTVSIESISSSHDHLQRLGSSMVTKGYVPKDSLTSSRLPSTQPPEAQKDMRSSVRATTDDVRNTTTNPSPKRFIQLGDFYATRVTSGYVKSPTGKVTATTANLVPTADGNVIGLDFARELELEVEPHTYEERITVGLGGRNTELSVGSLTLDWRYSAAETPYRPPITVNCNVIENSHVSLVLGKPFMNQLQLLWRRWSGS